MTQCDNIFFHTVGKDKHKNDEIEYTASAKYKLHSSEDHVDHIKKCVAKGKYIGATSANVRHAPNEHLTIGAKPGRNVHVICLKDIEATHFVENAQPILSLASFYPPFANLISEVTLYYTRADGTVIARGEKDGYRKPSNSEVPQWASFVVDDSLVKPACADSAIAVGDTLRIPLHFNLYNTVFEMPNWVAANHKGQHKKQEQEEEQDHPHNHDAPAFNMIHGGPHPDNPRNFLEIDLGP